MSFGITLGLQLGYDNGGTGEAVKPTVNSFSVEQSGADLLQALNFSSTDSGDHTAYVVYERSVSPEPSKTLIVNSPDSTFAGLSPGSNALSGVTPNIMPGDYIAYVVVQDSLGGQSDVFASASFTVSSVAPAWVPVPTGVDASDVFAVNPSTGEVWDGTTEHAAGVKPTAWGWASNDPEGESIPNSEISDILADEFSVFFEGDITYTDNNNNNEYQMYETEFPDDGEYVLARLNTSNTATGNVQVYKVSGVNGQAIDGLVGSAFTPGTVTVNLATSYSNTGVTSALNGTADAEFVGGTGMPVFGSKGMDIGTAATTATASITMFAMYRTTLTPAQLEELT